MAKALSPSQTADDATDAMTSTPVAECQASPDNTPIPGGGRWAWDDVAGQWVSRDLPSNPSLAE
jgi:hypothetical protein